MSKEVKTKEKVDMDPKYILTLTLTLLITSAIVAGVLGWVNSITSGPIAEFNRQKTETAMKAVVPDRESTFSDPLDITDEMIAAAGAYGATVNEAYAVQSAGADAGYTLKVTAAGSQGDIVMMVGVDADGVVTGVSIVKANETSGIGSKVTGNDPLASGTGVLDQFAGKTAADQPLKVGSNVDAISGATVSSKGVTKGVNAALAAVGAIG